MKRRTPWAIPHCPHHPGARLCLRFDSRQLLGLTNL